MRCGFSNPVKVKLPAPAINVKCGFSHTCVQLISEELYSWGLGDYGSSGNWRIQVKRDSNQSTLEKKNCSLFLRSHA